MPRPTPPLSTAPLRAAAGLRATRLRRLALGVLAGALAGMGSAGAALAERLALVVGNATYDAIYSLDNAATDATDVAAALERLDFKVTLLTDADAATFSQTLEAFANEADAVEAETVLFFFSGHGFQLGGANYLVPVDASLSSRAAIEAETQRLDQVIARLEARGRQTLVFLDACRNNPLPESVRDAGASDGLAQIETGSGAFIAFATQPNNITFDGTGRNSPFTTAFLSHIEAPGISISDMMIRVRNDVEQNTLRQQTPWDQSSLRSQFYFNPVYETTASLTAADYEMLAGLDPVRRAQFLRLLGDTGISFEIASIEEAEADIVAAGQLTITSIAEPAPDPAEQAPAPEEIALARPEDVAPALPMFDILPEGGAPEADSPDAAEVAAAEDTATEDLAPEFDLASLPEASTADLPATALAPTATVTARAGDSATSVRAGDTVTTARAGDSATTARAGDSATTARAGDSATTARAGDSATVVARAGDSAAPARADDAVTTARAGDSAAPVRTGDNVATDGLVVARADTATTATTITTATTAAPTSATGGVVRLAPSGGTVVAAAPTVSAVTASPGGRVVGQEVIAATTEAPETEVLGAEADTAIVLALAEPATEPTPEPEVEIEIPADLARGVQTELARVGCYRARIDGLWGRQSALATMRYFSGSDVSPDSLDPTEALYRSLVAEDEVICANTVAVARAIVRPQATPPVAATPRRPTRTRVIQAPTPTEAPRRTIGGGITGVFR